MPHQGTRSAAHGGAEGGEQRAHVVGDRGAQLGPQGLLARDGHRAGQRGDGIPGQAGDAGLGRDRVRPGREVQAHRLGPDAPAPGAPGTDDAAHQEGDRPGVVVQGA
ncbi:hypothetical protein [Streptomyces purpurascens]